MARSLLLLLLLLSTTSCASRGKLVSVDYEPVCVEQADGEIIVFEPPPPPKSKKQIRKESRGHCISCDKDREQTTHSYSEEDFNHAYETVQGPEITGIIYEYVPYLKLDKHLHLDRSYSVKRHGNLNVRLEFYSQDSLEMKDARKDLVDVVEGMLKRLNDNVVAVSHNNDQPFTADNLEIYITYQSFHLRVIDFSYVAYTSLRGGLSHFYAADAFDSAMQCWHKHGETYLQSLTIVNAERHGEELYRKKHPKATNEYDRLFTSDTSKKVAK